MARSDEFLRQCVASPRGECLEELGGILDHHRFEGVLLLAEEIGDVEFAGGAGLHADGGAIELAAFGHAERLGHQQSLAVVEHHRSEMEAELERAGDGFRHAGEQDVELSRLQSRQALLRRGGRELDFVRVVEHRNRQRPPEIDEEALPAAVTVRREKARLAADADLDDAARRDGVECGAGMGRCGREDAAGQRNCADRGHAPGPAREGMEQCHGLSDWGPFMGSRRRFAGLIRTGAGARTACRNSRNHQSHKFNAMASG